MRLATLIERFEPALLERYGERLLPGARRALSAMKRCRDDDALHLVAGCTECETAAAIPHSCGHRSCPRCQHHHAERWLDRHRERLLPVDYFLVTFTVPRELRALAFAHQRVVYDAMLRCAWRCLAVFAANDSALGVDIGAVAMLHTHDRRRDFHPHVHVIVPAGGVDRTRSHWRRKDHYLFNERNLARVFRGKLLAALDAAGLRYPPELPRQWVADCRNVGHGDEALTYLARYLYRGVLSEADILTADETHVTFRYRESKSRQWKTRTLPGADFLWLLLQHVLPRGFRCVRDYGLLHHRRRRLLQRVQCLLRVKLPAERPPARRPRLRCRRCGAPMRVLATRLFLEAARVLLLPTPVIGRAAM